MVTVNGDPVATVCAGGVMLIVVTPGIGVGVGLDVGVGLGDGVGVGVGLGVAVGVGVGVGDTPTVTLPSFTVIDTEFPFMSPTITFDRSNGDVPSTGFAVI
jgi:hypothetical protein